MSLPYSRADVSIPGHICLVCRFEIKMLELVDEPKSGQYVHASCGGDPNTAWENAQAVAQLKTELETLQKSCKIWKKKAVERRAMITDLRLQIDQLLKKPAKKG